MGIYPLDDKESAVTIGNLIAELIDLYKNCESEADEDMFDDLGVIIIGNGGEIVGVRFNEDSEVVELHTDIVFGE